MILSQSLIKKRECKPVGDFRYKTSIRRDKFLQRQNKLRASYFDELRERVIKTIVHPTIVNTTDVKTLLSLKDKKSNKISHSHHGHSGKYISQQLVIPDFLVDIPSNLATEWMAYRRPEGPRVILVAACGRCNIFSKVGLLLDSFITSLPTIGCTILEGVLVSPPEYSNTIVTSSEATHYEMDQDILKESSIIHDKKKKKCLPSYSWIAICDALTWSDCSLGNLPAECRYFLLKSKFEELKDSLTVISRVNERCLQLVEVDDASVNHLKELYHSSNEMSFSDSIMFIHKSAIYLPGPSQLYLCWRDSTLSRFPIDTINGNTITDLQTANLRLRLKDGAFLTEDRVVVATVLPENISTLLEPLDSTIYLTLWKKGKVKNELLIRVSIEGLDLDKSNCQSVQYDEDQLPMEQQAVNLLIGFKIIGTPSPKRNKAETLNRLIHQFMLRQQHQCDKQQSFCDMRSPWLTFDNILECSATGAPNFSMMLLKGRTHLEQLIDDEDDNDVCDEDYLECDNDDWQGW